MKQTTSSSRFCALLRRSRSVARFAAVVVLLSFAAIPAKADINTVTPDPSVETISAQDLSISIPVTWTVSRTETLGDGTGGAASRAVSSPNAIVIVNGSTIGTFGGALTRTSGFLTPGNTESLSFTETLVLPAFLIRRIAEAPAESTIIRRTFSDNTSASGAITVRMTLGNVGPLAVNRIGLSFDNDSRMEVVPQGESLRAVADVTYRGNGTLRGEWRLVDPAAALGLGSGRILEVVRLPLVSSGEGRTRIFSPPLPTGRNGLHLVSFSVTDTTAGFEIPVIRYFVLESPAGDAANMPVNMEALGPAGNAQLSGDTVFTWRPVAGAVAYQINLFAPGVDEPLAGQAVPNADLKLVLSPLVLEDLASGQAYEWQLRAVDASGKIIGISQRRRILVP